ncbi:MAG TPA: hypothetical protein VIK79_10595 [Xanthobacteraceae bacterium]
MGRLSRRIFDNKPVLDCIEHLRRVEERDIEGRLAAFRSSQPRDLVGPEYDGLRDRSAGSGLEGGGDDIAVRFVPGARKGRRDERLGLAECMRCKREARAQCGAAAQDASPVELDHHVNSPFLSRCSSFSGCWKDMAGID